MWWSEGERRAQGSVQINAFEGYLKSRIIAGSATAREWYTKRSAAAAAAYGRSESEENGVCVYVIQLEK